MLDLSSKILGALGVSVWAWLAVFMTVRLVRRLRAGGLEFSLARRPVLKPSGKWEGAPVPEIDKSTTGQLLAGRVRRNPEIEDRVATRPSPPDELDSRDRPIRRHGLWDRELDG